MLRITFDTNSFRCWVWYPVSFIRVHNIRRYKVKLQLVNEIIDCMPKERTIFRYFKDRYALMLLGYMADRELNRISDIKKSKFACLLEKPFVKDNLIKFSGGKVSKELINSVWPSSIHDFVLTVSKWDYEEPSWGQTSRKGFNLVLQLNFSNKHDTFYRKLVKPEYEQLLNYNCHPIYEQKGKEYFRETLAWSRIDIDFDTNEALIEEIQSDWVRDTTDLLRDAERAKKRKLKRIRYWDVDGSIDDVIHYCKDVMGPYKAIWSEAMLAATIDFIRNELGIKNIHYHSAKTGAKVKRISYTKPPVSLYEKLPKRFCFKKTTEAPEFLQEDKGFRRLYKKLPDPQWFKLAV